MLLCLQWQGCMPTAYAHQLTSSTCVQGPLLTPILLLGKNGVHFNLPQNKDVNPMGSSSI